MVAKNRSIEEWDSLQSTYDVGTELTQEQRKAQKKEGQFLHKHLNELGLKVQLKGMNNDQNQMVIGLPKKKWLLISVEEDSFYYSIGSDRTGKGITEGGSHSFNSREELLADIKEIVAKFPEPPTKEEIKAQAKEQEKNTQVNNLQSRFGVKLNFA